jgi:hypothetical protein
MTAFPTSPWPDLPYAQWKDGCLTLQLWTQVVGKIRLAKAPWINHSWQVTLYPTLRGITTSPIHDAGRALQIDFDFVEHALLLQSSEGNSRRLALRPQSVAQFYAQTLGAVEELGFKVAIDEHPSEMENTARFSKDTEHAAYDPEFANRFWRVLLSSHRVFQRFRSGFLGKCSPIHFFWGSFDLAVTRFSGRRAPLHRGGSPGLPDDVTREAYSHEVSSAGFWPGGGPIDHASFYSYAYPEPAGFAQSRVEPAAAYYFEDFGQFLLPYDAVRTAADPDEALFAFLRSTYEAAANLGGWDRTALECEFGRPRIPRRVG